MAVVKQKKRRHSQKPPDKNKWYISIMLNQSACNIIQPKNSDRLLVEDSRDGDDIQKVEQESTFFTLRHFSGKRCRLHMLARTYGPEYHWYRLYGALLPTHAFA